MAGPDPVTTEWVPLWSGGAVVGGGGGGGGNARFIDTVSSSTTLDAEANTDYVYFCDSTPGTITLTLPDAVGNTNQYIIKRMYGVNDVTVQAQSALEQSIDGGTTYVLGLEYQSVTLISNGTGDWMIV